MKDIVLIAHDIRSTHNVGSLLRTAEGLGIRKAYLTGYTPYPKTKDDSRLPHIATKLSAQIAKTALGAEEMLDWEHQEDASVVIQELRSNGYQIVALEQTSKSVLLPEFQSEQKIALLLGREVEGVDQKLIKLCDLSVEIPMPGKKESFNVVQAAAMTLYHVSYIR